MNNPGQDDRTFVRDARNAGKRSAVGFRWWAWLPRSVRVLNENMLPPLSQKLKTRKRQASGHRDWRH
jgi:hypothetical protein